MEGLFAQAHVGIHLLVAFRHRRKFFALSLGVVYCQESAPSVDRLEIYNAAVLYCGKSLERSHESFEYIRFEMSLQDAEVAISSKPKKEPYFLGFPRDSTSLKMRHCLWNCNYRQVTRRMVWYI